jgi:hypothetical protein
LALPVCAGGDIRDAHVRGHAATTMARWSTGLGRHRSVPAHCALGSASASTSIGALKHFPLVGLFLTVALFIPSIRSLKWRAMGWLHVLTLLCALFLYLICGLYLSGDSM